MTRFRTSLLLLAAIFLLAGCQSFPRHKLHYTLLEKTAPRLPDRVLLMPLELHVMELSAGGIQEEVPEWTAQAKRLMRTALEGNPRHYGGLEIIPLPPLSPEQQQQVEQHATLYQTVASSALWFARPPVPAWQHKAERFDYTLGDGLAFLAEQTGANTALFISGEDVISTGGRKTTAFLAAAFGVQMPLGHAVVISSLVDLQTGNILWLNFDTRTDSTTLIESEDTIAILDRLFKNYPGLEAYRKSGSGH